MCRLIFFVRLFKVGLPTIISFLIVAEAVGQELKPGLDGMSPIKWISIKNTQAPGRSYKTLNSLQKVYTQEDFFFKMWLPVLHKKCFSLAVAPTYRTEQLEMEDSGTNEIHTLSNWNLRSIGADIKSLIKVDSSSWLMVNAQINKSGNLNNYSYADFPYNYTLSSAFVKKKSSNKEWGLGLAFNRNNRQVMLLPIVIFHYNFSSKMGIEISIPYKMAWRFNATSSNIVYVKAEASSRSYFIKKENCAGNDFRRTDIDFGVSYNKLLNRFVGFEIFVGYKQNINNVLPSDVIAVKPSGMSFSWEFYIRPPFRMAK